MTKTTALVRPHAKGHPGLIFQEAKREISEAKTVEKVNDIRKKAMALAAYALQANNRQLKEEAEAIRMMAERRIGQMMQEQKKTVGLNAGTAGRGRPKKGGLSKNPPKKDAHPTLAEAGIDKNLAHKARKAAAKSDDAFAKEANGQRRGILRAKRRRPQRRQSRSRHLAWSANGGSIAISSARVRDRLELRGSGTFMDRWNQIACWHATEETCAIRE